MINCEIISVRNTEIKKYNKRNNLIDEFLSINKIPNMIFNLSEAVKPSDWFRVENNISYDGLIFKTCHRLAHDHGITNFLSHYKIWKKMGKFLIIEDDLIMDEKKFEEVTSIINKFDNLNIDNKILSLQSSCPWREGFPFKEYQNIIDFSDDFYLLHSLYYNDISGTAAYYIDVDDVLLKTLTDEIGATDGILDNLRQQQKIYYFIPKKWKNYFELNAEVQ